MGHGEAFHKVTEAAAEVKVPVSALPIYVTLPLAWSIISANAASVMSCWPIDPGMICPYRLCVRLRGLCVVHAYLLMHNLVMGRIAIYSVWVCLIVWAVLFGHCPTINNLVPLLSHNTTFTIVPPVHDPLATSALSSRLSHEPTVASWPPCVLPSWAPIFQICL